AHQLGGAGVEARDGGQLVVGAVLGGEALVARDQLRQLLAVLLPGGVGGLRAGQMVEHGGLEVVDQLLRLADARDQVIAAAGDELALAGKPQEVETDGVVELEAGEEPAVEAGLGQSGLDGGNSFGQHGTSLSWGRIVSDRPAGRLHGDSSDGETRRDLLESAPDSWTLERKAGIDS